MPAFRNSREHLFAELYRLDLLLNLQIERQRRAPASAGFDEFRGLFISEQEIDHLIDDARQAGSSLVTDDTRAMGTLLSTTQQYEQQMAEMTAAALAQGRHLSLPRLAQLFNLAPFDVDVLLVCLAPELDLKYEKLYAYLQNDVTRKKPSVALILDLLCRSLEEQLQARTHILADAPLLREQLVTFPTDGHNEHQNLLARSLKIDDRILNYLLDVETIDEQLAPCARVIVPAATFEELVLPNDLKASLVRLFQHQMGALNHSVHGGRLFLFQGPSGVGKRTAAEALCRLLGVKLLVVDLAELLATGYDDAPPVVRIFREARLQSAALYLDHMEILTAENDRAGRIRQRLLRLVEEFPGIVFAGSTQTFETLSQSRNPSVFSVVFPPPDYALRQQLWRISLQRAGCVVAKDVDLDDLADKFNFTAGNIGDAIVEAKRRSAMRRQDATYLAAADLYQACRTLSSTKLAVLARKITPLYTWNDIILPGDTLRQLQEICAQAKHRQQVFGQWGFDGKMSLGKGLSILFVGPSGTGKTMAAEIIARELQLELYKIDLAGVVSKYIGETEKNLSKIFEEAEQSNAILFFDEADALFGKRSQVKDAHDRYANIEINYLLQKMEEYEGVTILASNFRKNIDEAFTRRLRFIVDFPFPDEAYRRRIWEHIFPNKISLDADIDVAFLARQLQLTGGNIRNIALNAAFLAAADGGVVTMEYLIRSTKREYQKMGRLCVKADFGQYYDLVSDEQSL